MRIAQISPYSMSVPGGVQGQAAGLAHTMRSFGFEVDVIAPSDLVTSSEYFINLGHSVNFSANGSMAPISISAFLARRISRVLKVGNYQIVHIHEPAAPFVGVLSLAMARGVVVGTFHRSGVSGAYRTYGRLVSGLTNRLAYRYAVSEAAAATAHKAVGGSYEVVGNGVDIARFRDAAPWPKERFVVLFIGRHEHRKGLSVLIEAAKKTDRDFEVWIAGDGGETLALREDTQEDARFIWLGRISDQEAVARMLAADVVCAPSLYGESFGLVLLEAMAADAAVIATDISGYRDVARSDREAILVRPGDQLELASALRRLIDDDELRQGLQERGHARALEFSMAKLAEKYLDKYEELILEGHNGSV
ncbi:MAG: glycosyltransferase family 4 protein [Acidimicrobiaceae bacterium]|nr:glycosyltransferase family 4 protein [Acidimicrobiaceae bacterium]